jgi:hypothetical protein
LKTTVTTQLQETTKNKERKRKESRSKKYRNKGRKRVWERDKDRGMRRADNNED